MERFHNLVHRNVTKSQIVCIETQQEQYFHNYDHWKRTKKRYDYNVIHCYLYTILHFKVNFIQQLSPLPENCQHHDARQRDIVTGLSWK